MTTAAFNSDFDLNMLDFSMFNRDDLVNLVLQRSEVLADTPRFGRLIRAWEDGDHGPLFEKVDQMGREIAVRAARIIYSEYAALAGTLDGLAPKYFADIGCGYAMFDFFAHRRLGCDLLLIDIEESDERHFGYRDEGAGYSNLATARDFLVANGVPEGGVRLWNPSHGDPPDIGPVDLAASFLSCGFHYPIDMYLPFFRFGVRPGGGIMLDLRAGRTKQAMAQLSRLGTVSKLPGKLGARRVLVKKKEEK